MDITEVRIKLMDEPGERLKAFCSITFDDCFVVRDLKIIEGSNGPFVAMPSRKLTAHCPACGVKNHLRSAHCNQCGGPLDQNRAFKDEDGRAKLYADIAHPIHSHCRELIQERVLSEYSVELERAKDPSYVSRYDDYYGEISPPQPDRPTRIDQPHAQPAAQSGRRQAPCQPTSHGPHIPRPRSENAPPAPKDDFGAGIF